MRRVTILAYHAVGECPRSEDKHNLFVSEASFAEQMAYLARRRTVVSLADAFEARIPGGPPAVAITFDDGYRNVLQVAGPILERHGFPAAVFVPTDWRGRVNGWIEPTSCDLEIMGDEELRACEQAGIAVESHGHAHIDMSASSREEVERDIVTSLDELQKVIGRRPRFLAYPYGRLTDRTPEIAKGTGLSAAFTIDERHAGPYACERVQVTPLDSRLTFALKTTGRYLAIRESRVVTTLYRGAKPLARKVLQRKRV